LQESEEREVAVEDEVEPRNEYEQAREAQHVDGLWLAL
jgi:hypothetical protein